MEMVNEWRREDCHFDRIQGELVLSHVLESGICGEVLDIACGDGILTQILSRGTTIESIYGVDISGSAVEVAKSRQYSCHTHFSVSSFEVFNCDKLFDAVVAINVLEHVNDHVAFLKRIKSFLKPSGKAFIYVPNADSLHVLLAVEMGVIPDKYFLNQWQRDFCGHTIHYDSKELNAHIEVSGLKIIDSGSIIFKPFSNGQMDYLLDSDQWGAIDKENKEKRGWALSSESFIKGLYALGKHPDLNKFGSTLFAHCTL